MTEPTPPPKLTVGELIAKLQTFPAELRVVVDGYEEGFEDLLKSSIQMEKVRLYAHNDGTDEFNCYGPHALEYYRDEELDHSRMNESNGQVELAVCLTRRQSPEFEPRDQHLLHPPHPGR